VGNQGTNYVTLASGRYAVSEKTPVYETIVAGSPVAHHLEPGIVFEADGDPEEVPGGIQLLVYRVRSCIDGTDTEGHVTVETSSEKLRPWRRHHKVLHETPLTSGAASDGSEPLRQLQADELVDLLDLPVLDQATGEMRAQCIALGDSIVGWATIREAESGDAHRMNLEPVPAPVPQPAGEQPAARQQDVGADPLDNGNLQQSQGGATQDPTPEEVQFNIARPPPPPGRGSPSSNSEQMEQSGSPGRMPAARENDGRETWARENDGRESWVPPPPPPRQGQNRTERWSEDKGKGRSGEWQDRGKGRHGDYFEKGTRRMDPWHEKGRSRFGDYHNKGKGRPEDWGKGRSRMTERFDKGKGRLLDDRGKGGTTRMKGKKPFNSFSKR